MPRKAASIEKETSSKVVKKIPASETGAGKLCITRSGKQYRISQNPEKQRHTLWRVVDGGFEKIATSKSPVDLSNMINWEE